MFPMLSSQFREEFALYPDSRAQVAFVLGADQSADPESTYWVNGAAIFEGLDCIRGKSRRMQRERGSSEA